MQRDSSKMRLTDSYFQFVATPAESDRVTTDTEFLLLASRTEVLEVMEPLAPKFGDTPSIPIGCNRLQPIGTSPLPQTSKKTCQPLQRTMLPLYNPLFIQRFDRNARFVGDIHSYWIISNTIVTRDIKSRLINKPKYWCQLATITE